MTRQITITPLHCTVGGFPEAAYVWTEDRYAAADGPAVYCNNPDASWFRLRAAENSPYIQAPFFGVRPGDRLTVTFDAMTWPEGGTAVVELAAIGADCSIGKPVTHALPAGAVTTYFKTFDVPAFITLDAEDIGLLVRVRPGSASAELIIKNVAVRIATSNNELQFVPGAVCYDDAGDFLEYIHTVSGTDVDPVYAAVHDMYVGGDVELVDDEVLRYGPGEAPFKGVMAMGRGSCYGNPVGVYFEYRQTDAADVIVRVRGFDALGRSVAEWRETVPGATGWTPVGVMCPGSHMLGVRRIVADVGLHGSAADLELRRVRFSFPRFDDAVKAEPNRLADLYSDLGVRLRGLRR